MKKMITALCVLAVAIGSMMAASNYIKAEPVRKMKMVNDQGSSNSSGKYVNGFTESAPFNQSPNGYGFIYGYNRKIAWMPENNLYVSVYREKSGSGTGSIGGMAGNWTDGNNCTTISSHSATMNCRYPGTAGIDKYGFGIFNHNNHTATTPSAYVAVYDKDEEGWTPPINVKAPNGQTPFKAWCGSGEATKDAAGNYYLMTSWEFKDLNNSANPNCVSVGKSATPYVASSWTWTDYNNMADSSVTDGSKQFFELNRFETAWGKNGFGIVMTIGKEAETDLNAFFYTYTKDYGQTWVKDASNKWFKVTKQLPFIGKSYSSDAGDVLIEEAFMFTNFDIVVDANNDVHLLHKSCVGTNNGQNLQLGIAETTDNTPVGGFWHWGKGFDAQGNPEAADWDINFVAQHVGFAETDNAPVGADGQPTYFEYRYSNGVSLSINDCGNGTLVASWLDRSETDAMLATDCATALGATWDAGFLFMADPYVIVSTDYGKTWQYADAQLRRAHHIKVNADQKIHEEGFSISRGVKTGDTVELYAAYQKANYNAPGSPPVDAPAAYENNLHVMKMIINPVGIETEDVTNGRTIELAQNYPNPFNPTTTINFNLQTASNVKLSVFNANGQIVADLINSRMNSGAHTANFNAANLNSGVYFYKLTVDGQSAVKKMVLTK